MGGGGVEPAYDPQRQIFAHQVYDSAHTPYSDPGFRLIILGYSDVSSDILKEYV